MLQYDISFWYGVQLVKPVLYLLYKTNLGHNASSVTKFYPPIKKEINKPGSCMVSQKKWKFYT